jgi:signal peptidase II
MFKKNLLLAFILVLIDQAIKVYVKTHFSLGEEVRYAGNWAIIHFTENNGMAFGMELETSWGKIFLSSFRVVAITVLVYILYYLHKTNAPKLFQFCMTLVFAGALGNIIDSVFYGVWFNDSYGKVAEFMPGTGGYAPYMYGKVVDMFYFPMIETQYPSWFPFWANEQFVFFNSIFNFADFCISTGVGIMIFNQKKFFK